MLITSQDRNPAFIDLYTTDQQGGNKILLIKNEGKTLRWVLAKNLTPQLRFNWIKADMTRLLVMRDSGWQRLIDVVAAWRFQTSGFHKGE